MRILTSLIVALLFAAPTFGQAVSIVNAGFEDLILSNNGFSPNIPGWTRSGDSGTFNPSTSSYAGEAPEGNNVAYSATGGPTIAQILSTVLDVDTEYTLEVEVGNRLNIAFGGYEISLLAGGVELASETNEVSPANGQFETASLTYMSSAADTQLGQALEIRLRSFGPQTNFDDVRLNAVSVPEPSTVGVLFLAALMGSIARKRSRNC